VARKPKPAPPKQHQRGWSEGSVTEVRPGTFRAFRARVHRPDGTTSRPSRTFTGPHAAESAARWAAGEPQTAVMYVGQWLERWLALREPLLRQRTREGYRRHVTLCGDLLLRPLADVTADDWQLRANTLLSERARDSVRNWRTTIKAALGAAVPRYLADNPLRGVKLPKANERPVRAFSSDELAAFLRACVGSRYEVWVHLSLGTGLRLSESRGLTWDKVDLREQTILIDSAIDQVTNEVGPTKTGRIRTVDIPDELVATLASHRARQLAQDRYVIGCGATGRPLSTSAISDFMRRTCDAAGITRRGPHALRHTFATHALDAGESLKEVSETLGHANVAITGRVYSHNVKRRRRGAANVMGRLIAESLSTPAPRAIAAR
jgi:integrase